MPCGGECCLPRAAPSMISAGPVQSATTLFRRVEEELDWLELTRALAHSPIDSEHASGSSDKALQNGPAQEPEARLFMSMPHSGIDPQLIGMGGSV